MVISSCNNSKRNTDRTENKKVNEQVSDISGKIQIEGDDVLLPFMQDFKNDFRSIYPKVEVNVTASNSGYALQNLNEGVSDLVLISTPGSFLKSNDYSVVPFARDLLVLIVNFNNSYLQTLVMYGISKKNISDMLTLKKTFWKQLDSRMSGEEPLKMFIPSKNSGTTEYIASFAGLKKEQIKVDDVVLEKDIPVNVTNQLISVGFCSHTLAYDHHSGLRKSDIYIIGIDVDNSNFLENNELIYDDLTKLSTAVKLQRAPHELIREFSAVYRNDSPNMELIEIFVKHLKIYGSTVAQKLKFFPIID